MKNWLIWTFFVFSSFIFCVWISDAAGNCILPFGDEHSYVSASVGQFNANSTHLINYPITLPITDFHTFNWECQEQRGYRYVLRSVEAPEIFFQLTKFWMCIELHKVDNYTFYYFLGTKYHRIAQDNVLGSSIFNVTFDQACNVPYPYDQQTFIMLVQEDAFRSGLLTIRCPNDLLAVFLSINASSSAGSTASCPGNTLDVCSNRTTMSFRYNNSCSAPAKATSTGGRYSCLYNTQVGDSSYLGLWNQDTTVDGTRNYRYSCLAYKKVGSTVYATETPKNCTSKTTATVPGDNGVTFVIWDIERTCLDQVTVIPDKPVDITWLYYLIGGLLALPLLMWFICLFTWCYKKYGCICKRIKLPEIKRPKLKNKRLDPKPEPEPDMEIDVSEGDKVERLRFTGVITQAPDYNMSTLFRPKKPIDDFTMLSSIFLEQKPMYFLEAAPKVAPIYKDSLDDYMSRGIRRSSTQTSLDSIMYEKKNEK